MENSEFCLGLRISASTMMTRCPARAATHPRLAVVRDLPSLAFVLVNRKDRVSSSAGNEYFKLMLSIRYSSACRDSRLSQSTNSDVPSTGLISVMCPNAGTWKACSISWSVLMVVVEIVDEIDDACCEHDANECCQNRILFHVGFDGFVWR